MNKPSKPSLKARPPEPVRCDSCGAYLHARCDCRALASQQAASAASVAPTERLSVAEAMARVRITKHVDGADQNARPFASIQQAASVAPDCLMHATPDVLAQKTWPFAKAASAASVAPTEASDRPIHNPWRESLENCINGSNYLRASEYRALIEELDTLYAADARLASIQQAGSAHARCDYDRCRTHGCDGQTPGCSEQAGSAAPAPATDPLNPTNAQLADACMWMRHDFGLFDVDTRVGMMAECREWWRAVAKAMKKENSK